jgi:hypothetical protein
MALKINKGNLEALEELMKDSIIANIATLKRVGDGRTGRMSTMVDSTHRLMLDFMKDDWNLIQNPTSALGIYMYYFKHADRYPMTSTGTTSPQSEFDESSYLQAQLCVQALAFNDQRALKTICNGAVLKSPFKGVTGYDMSYDQRLTSHLNDKGVTKQMQQSLNHSERICAFRDFNRKNMVLFMSINKK